MAESARSHRNRVISGGVNANEALLSVPVSNSPVAVGMALDARRGEIPSALSCWVARQIFNSPGRRSVALPDRTDDTAPARHRCPGLDGQPRLHPHQLRLRGSPEQYGAQKIARARCAFNHQVVSLAQRRASAFYRKSSKAITSATAPNIAVFLSVPLQAFPTVETCAMRGARYPNRTAEASR